MAGQVDLNPKTNPLIDPLTLPGRDVGNVDLKKLFQTHKDKLHLIIDLYLNYQQWGNLRSAANWVFSWGKKDEKSQLLEILPSYTFTSEVRKLLHLKIVEQFAGKEALDFLGRVTSQTMRYDIAYAFVMLTPEDRTPENFELIRAYVLTYKKSMLCYTMEDRPRDIRGVCMKFLSSTPENTGVLFDTLKVVLYHQVDLEKFKLFVTKLIPFVLAGCKVEKHDGKTSFNPDHIDIRTKETPILFFAKLHPQDMTEETLCHTINLFQSLVKASNQQLDDETNKLDKLFGAIPKDNHTRVLAEVGSFLARFDEGQKKKMPLAFRTFLVYFVHLQMSQGTTEKDLMYSLYNLKEVLITIDFDPDLLKILNNTNDLQIIEYTIELIKKKDVKTFLATPPKDVGLETCARIWAMDKTQDPLTIFKNNHNS